MKKRFVRFAGMATLLSALLCGCQGQHDKSLQPQQPEMQAEQITAQWLMEEGHQAAWVGDYLVTAEIQEAENEYGHEAVLTVWDPDQQEAPLQSMTVATQAHSRCEANDANFDGALDLGWMYFAGNQPRYLYYWIWDGDKFVEEPAFRDISDPVFDAGTQTITGWARSSGAGTGLTTLHKWEEGQLLCVRRIEVEGNHQDPYVMTVEDREDGVLSQVYYAEFPADSPGSFFAERTKWENLDYHGEV